MKRVTSIILAADGQHPNGVVGLECGHYVMVSGAVIARLTARLQSDERVLCPACRDKAEKSVQ